MDHAELTSCASVRLQWSLRLPILTRRMSLSDLGWRSFFAEQLGDEDDLRRVQRVVAIHRNGHVLSDGATESSLHLGRFWYRKPAEERPTVGDWVILDRQGGRIERCLERANVLQRIAAGTKTDVQLIGANVDALFIVTSCNLEFSPSRLQRFLALAQSTGVEPLIVLTKADLASEPKRFANQASAIAPDVHLEVVNALDAGTLSGVRTWLRPAQTIALLGSSGVGKSTLLNTLAGERVQVTRPIREDDARGRHTTTSRSLLRLPQGALVLDGPGVRELGMAVADEDIGELYEDIEALARTCRFADCGHGTEPGCAVRAAVEAGEMTRERLASYAELLAERRRHAESLTGRDRRAERLERSRRRERDEDSDDPDT